MITDVLHHFSQKFHMAGIFAVFHPAANFIAEDPPVIFMPGKEREAAGIGEHTD